MRASTKAILVGALLGAAGCNTYSYLDFQTKIDPSLGSQAAQTIATCHMYVTGAVTDDFAIDTLRDGMPLCPPAPPNLPITRVNYSTFAESGDVTFTFKGYSGVGQNCEIAEGSTTMKIMKGLTTVGPDLSVTAHTPAAGCQ